VFSDKAIKPREFSTSVWEHPVIPTWAHKYHKNEKPLGLIERLIRVFTDPGALIIDPFAGSGTTGVAALNLGRRFLGWEADPTYHAIAIDRLNNRDQPRPQRGTQVPCRA
jgi:site-specific DNA-methyltransferase (adenine-specific)